MGLGALPEQTLAQMLGGFLLTYFRSAHPSPGQIRLLRDYEFATGQGSVDFIIYDETNKKPLAAFVLARAPSDWNNKRALVQDLASIAAHRLIVGIVAPESFAPTVRGWAKKHDVEVVTFPD